jgi:hypothetical protein
MATVLSFRRQYFFDGKTGINLAGACYLDLV